MYTVYCDEFLIYSPDIDELMIYHPKLDLELNKTGSFTFSIYPAHPYFNQLRRLKSIITVFHDGDLLFRGRILNDEQGFYNEKQVSCEGELAFLLDSIQRPYDFLSGENHTTIEELFTFFINNHNEQVDPEHRFIVGNITVVDPNNYIVRSDSQYLTTWDSIQKKLIDGYGGYLWVRHEPDGNYIDYLADFDVLSSQSVEFGKNLLNLNRITKGEDIATAIIPLGAKIKDENGKDTEQRVTIAQINGGIDYVMNEEAVERYGKIFKTVVWDDVTVPENLKRKAEETLSDAINLIVTIELDAVDLSSIDTDINSFKLGRYVRVITSPHSLNSAFLVQKLSLDLLNPKSNKLTLGTTYSTFTEQATGNGKNLEGLVASVEQANANYTLNQAKVNEMQDYILQLVEQFSSEISQMSDQIRLSVNESVYLKEETDQLISSLETILTQTAEAFEFRFNEFNADVSDVASGVDARFSELSRYIRFVDGNIVLGEEGNELTLRIQSDRISFLEGSAEVAYFSNNKLYVLDGEYINSLKIGQFAFLPRSNGNLSFKKVT